MNGQVTRSVRHDAVERAGLPLLCPVIWLMLCRCSPRPSHMSQDVPQPVGTGSPVMCTPAQGKRIGSPPLCTSAQGGGTGSLPLCKPAQGGGTASPPLCTSAQRVETGSPLLCTLAAMHGHVVPIFGPMLRPMRCCAEPHVALHAAFHSLRCSGSLAACGTLCS